ncbi:MAG: glycoside hydrolase [Bacteroidetes bacterium]|nr:glycoside hydrolase [Bacteroidota bacterium]
MGAWHAYSLPHRDSTKYYGGFCGPLIMKMYGQWSSKCIANITLKDGLTKENIDISKARAKMIYYPGKLVQILKLPSFIIKMNLIFVNNKTALINTKITNESNKDRSLILGFKGKLLLPNAYIELVDNDINIKIKDKSEYLVLNTNLKNPEVKISKDKKIYFLQEKKSFLLKSQKSKDFAITQSYFFSKEENENIQKELISNKENISQTFKDNTKRWNAYIKKSFGTKDCSIKDKKVLVKTIETLISNWRSAAGELKHDGLFPSTAYQGFYGFWSWDSWKHAVALSKFFPELAKNSILSMFDYQDDMGMVADCIYFNSKENNLRDTKAPLSAWAVWNVYENTRDTNFVKQIYPKLVKYHNWWYTYRDHNKNNVCEYGSTDGSLIAAKWESGMDNAVRFDSTQIIKNNDYAWSMNQESVDLNSYLYAEKNYLSSMSTLLKNNDFTKWKDEAQELKKIISTEFWDEETGFFYDRDINTKKLILKQQGSEGWIPLWAKIASKAQAEKVRQVILDTAKFNSRVPFPTLSADNAKFNPLSGYWRGPVWLDQAYFGIVALENYSYFNEALALKRKILDNAQGINANTPIFENYHPLTGKGLNAKHFSWSAAHLYMIIQN